MRELFEQGKIRAIGVSNFSVQQMDEFRAVTPLHVLQPPYNLFERAIEAEILPYCRNALHRHARLWRALPRPVLRQDHADRFDGDDLRRTDPKFVAALRTISGRGAARRVRAQRFGKTFSPWRPLGRPGPTALWGARVPTAQSRARRWAGRSTPASGIDRILARPSRARSARFMAPPAGPDTRRRLARRARAGRHGHSDTMVRTMAYDPYEYIPTTRRILAAWLVSGALLTAGLGITALWSEAATLRHGGAPPSIQSPPRRIAPRAVWWPRPGGGLVPGRRRLYCSARRNARGVMPVPLRKICEKLLGKLKPQASATSSTDQFSSARSDFARSMRRCSW